MRIVNQIHDGRVAKVHNHQGIHEKNAPKTGGSPLILAANRKPVPHTPVWFMRQAGRSLPEYRAARSSMPMLTACMTPDLVVELTMQPVRRHGVDAAILFSDIVVPLKASGIEVEIVAGTGPVIAKPIRSSADVAAVRPLVDDDISAIAQAVHALVSELGSTPLIGFAGAPFTLASYLIEGGPSKTHARTKALMYSEPDVWHALLDLLADITLTFLRTQIRCGVAAIQLFDSWAGALSEKDYHSFVLPHSARILGALADSGVPRIHFGLGTGHLLEAIADAGADVVGVDWRTPLSNATQRLGDGIAVQGNLDPAVVLADWPVIESEVRRVLADGKTAPGHIFNLGHGVLPETPPEVLTRIVELVHQLTAA